MLAIRAASIGIGVAAVVAIGAFTSPAKADGWHHGWGHHGWWGPGVVYAPPPYYYAPPPPYYYAPPPVVYAPPPAYYSPGISLGVAIR